MSISEISDEDFLKLRARNRALGKIMYETRFGEVEGITFDLRHDQINPDEWIMDHLGAHDGLPPRRTPTLPFIWFPWYGNFDLEQLKADVAAEFLEYRNNDVPMPREAFDDNFTDEEYARYLKKHKKSTPLGKSWISKEVAARTPDAVVKAGDRIRIHEVIKNVGHDEFVHPHDNAEISLFIKITNDAGVNKVIRSPIIMYGATRLTYRHGNKALYSILERIRIHHRLDKINRSTVADISRNYHEKSSAFAALYRAEQIYERYLPRIRKLENSNINQIRMIGFNYVDALDNACMLGYAWAHAETELRMRPLAMAALASKAGAAKAGLASAAKRRARALNWQARVKTEALKIRAKAPDVSQTKVAEEILYQLGEEELPSLPIIVRQISKLERGGELPKRRK
jgi:hypothetical protein